MQTQKPRIFPDCLCCGERLEKKNEILTGLVLCPKCQNEHYVDAAYKQEALVKLSQADQKRTDMKFNEAYDAYELISGEHPELIESYWGMFLSTYGIIYEANAELKRYGPVIHIYLEEAPTSNAHYKQVLSLCKDMHQKEHYAKECELIEKIWQDTKPVLKRAERKAKKSEPVTQETNQNTETQAYKDIGSKLPKDYQIDPILDNKIKNAEIIYMKANKFSRANKIFDEVLEIDPCARRAIWDKLLCKLQVSDFELVGPNIKLNVVFDLFEEIMQCLPKAEDNIYLKFFEDYFYKKLESSNTFDEELYQYILKWKNKFQQHTFSDGLFDEIKDILVNKELSDVSWVHIAMANAEKYNEVEKHHIFVEHYLQIADILNQGKFFKDAEQMIDLILLSEDQNHDAHLIKLCAVYKISNVSELHLVLKDMKQIKPLEELLASGYEKMDVFDELKLAAIESIDKGNFKQAIQIIEYYINNIPRKEKDALNTALLQFAENLIYYERFKDAEKYADLLLVNDPLLPEAHWCKLKIALGANTNFDVLMYSKKDLMTYPDFERAINSTSHAEDYIKFYEIHDQLKQKTPNEKRFVKIAIKHYDELEALVGKADIHEFVNETFEVLKQKIKGMSKEERVGVSKLVIRSSVILFLIGLAYIMSNIRALFDPSGMGQGSEIAAYILRFYVKYGGYALFGLLLIAFALAAGRDGHDFWKSVLKGLYQSLIFTAIGLITVGAIPWALMKYASTTVFRFADMVILGQTNLVIFGGLHLLVLIGMIFIFIFSQRSILSTTDSKKAIVLSIVNMVVLSLIWVASIALTYFQIF